MVITNSVQIIKACIQIDFAPSLTVLEQVHLYLDIWLDKVVKLCT